MKKLLAILLSAVLLCTMIPFVTVSAAGDHYIELVADAKEVDAGDEIAVEVSLYGHESKGIIWSQVELSFDPNVFELVTTFDEDEEVWMPPIEVGSKFNASSNKYILFSPIDEETGNMKRCLVQFDRATASDSQAVKTNLFYTVTFKVKDDAVSGDYTIEVTNHNNKNIVLHGNQTVEWSMEPITITVNGTEPEVPTCNHEFFNDCDTICMICNEEVREASHNVIHVEAVEATCQATGNVEYWCCDACGAAWLDEACTQITNRFNVITVKDHEYLYACDTVCKICWEETNPDADHNIIHVEAKPAVSCIEFGNKEYWYCEYCSAAWLDEDLFRITNLKSVSTASECVSDAQYPCQDGVCINCGMDYIADDEHTWKDATCTKPKTCTVCGETEGEKLGHSYKTVVTKATLTKDGSSKSVCTVCGYTASKVTTIYKASKISLSKTSYTYNGKVQKPTVIVKDSKGNTISSSNYTVTYPSGMKNAGTYTVKVTFKGSKYSGTKTLTYKINGISVSKCKITLSKTSFTYNGKVQKPTVTVKNHNGTKLTTSSYTVTYASGCKNVGTYKVTIKMKGNYTGTKTLTFTINPVKTSISKITAASKKLTVKWAKKTTQVTGYEIQYATSKTFKSYKTKTVSKNSTISTSLTGLKAKTTYYVRVRTYKTVNGKKVYSGWSTVKSMKTK